MLHSPDGEVSGSSVTEAQDGFVEAVRRGYNAVSVRYRADDAETGKYQPWITRLLELLSPGSRVLDLGCGCGVPVTRDLTAAGHAVTGVDLSDVQVERARRLVPTATFIRADAAALRLPLASYDAVVALYSIIHLPLAAQPPLLRAIAGWLVPDGTLLLSAGWRAWTGFEPNWLGGDATMWWSTPTRRRTGDGWPKPACECEVRSSSPRATADTACFGRCRGPR